MTVTFLSSLTRISDLDTEPYEIARISKEHWATGDYVMGEITGPRNRLLQFELASGRMIQALRRDCVVGALGNRAATLEATGSCHDTDPENGFPIQALTQTSAWSQRTVPRSVTTSVTCRAG